MNNYSQRVPQQLDLLQRRFSIDYHDAPVIRFSLINTKEFTARTDGVVNREIISLLKMVPGVCFEWKTKRWVFPLSSHDTLQVGLSKCKVSIEPLPRNVIVTAQLQNRREQEQLYHTGESDLPHRIHARLYNALAGFQKLGVEFVVKNKGRAMIADEMGLGKTIQSIACAAVYRDEWPVLVVVPSSARYQWQSELLAWLSPELINQEHIALVDSGSFQLHFRHKFVVISYNLVHAVEAQLKSHAFGMIIADESHYLKNGRARRSRFLLPLLRSSKRAILLSGTPALSRPLELFTQLNVLAPDTWPNEAAFVERYCCGRKTKNAATTTIAATNTAELHTMLRATIMLRRLKNDILTQLPKKRRLTVSVTVQDAAIADRLRGLLDEIMAMSRNKKTRKRPSKDVLAAEAEMYTEVPAAAEPTAVPPCEAEAEGDAKVAKKSLLMALFNESGHAKLPSILKHLENFLDNPLSGKILVFAHHRVVLEGVSSFLRSRDQEHIRIDGYTLAKDRHTRVQQFQHSATCRVAVLAITAAGVAITLTAASTVFFAEMFWTPGAMLQAEDRAHRIGQLSTVTVTYFLAAGTIDDLLWPLLRTKMRTLGEVVEGEAGVDLHTQDAGGGDENGETAGIGAVEGVPQDLEVIVDEVAQEDVQRNQSTMEEDDGSSSDEDTANRSGKSIARSSSAATGRQDSLGGDSAALGTDREDVDVDVEPVDSLAMFYIREMQHLKQRQIRSAQQQQHQLQRQLDLQRHHQFQDAEQLLHNQWSSQSGSHVVVLDDDPPPVKRCRSTGSTIWDALTVSPPPLPALGGSATSSAGSGSADGMVQAWSRAQFLAQSVQTERGGQPHPPDRSRRTQSLPADKLREVVCLDLSDDDEDVSKQAPAGCMASRDIQDSFGDGRVPKDQPIHETYLYQADVQPSTTSMYGASFPPDGGYVSNYSQNNDRGDISGTGMASASPQTQQSNRSQGQYFLSDLQQKSDATSRLWQDVSAPKSTRFLPSGYHPMQFTPCDRIAGTNPMDVLLRLQESSRSLSATEDVSTSNGEAFSCIINNDFQSDNNSNKQDDSERFADMELLDDWKDEDSFYCTNDKCE